MRKLLFIAILFAVHFASAQSYIITTNNDTLKCRITKVTDTRLFFDYKAGSEWRSSLMALSKVSSYGNISDLQIKEPTKKNQTSNQAGDKSVVERESVIEEEGSASIGNSSQTEANKSQPPVKLYDTYESIAEPVKDNLPKITRINLRFGYSQFTNVETDGMSDSQIAYIDDLKTGGHFKFDLAFFNEGKSGGFGLTYQNFFTDASGEGIDGEAVVFNPNVFGGLEVVPIEFDLQESLRTHSILLSFRNRSILKDNASMFEFGLYGGLGYLTSSSNFSNVFNTNNGERLELPNIDYDAYGPALGADIGFDILLGDNVYFNISASYIIHRITRIIIDGQSIELSGDQIGNNDHFNIGAGLSFHIR